MHSVTTAFYVNDENKQRHDTILLYFVKEHAEIVSAFMEKLSKIGEVSNELWKKYLPGDYARLNKILSARIQYMAIKVGEYGARQIDDNEF